MATRVGDPVRRELPAHLAEAIERGVLTQEQLRELIAFEAEQIGLTFDEAVRQARAGTIRRDPHGSSIWLLVGALES
jgi:hypothetical protein